MKNTLSLVLFIISIWYYLCRYQVLWNAFFINWGKLLDVGYMCTFLLQPNYRIHFQLINVTWYWETKLKHLKCYLLMR